MKDRFFVYCNESGFELFETLDDALDAANERIQGYLEDAWSDEVTSVCAGKITHRAKMCDQVFPDGEIDEEGLDESGELWDPDWEYKCNYKMLPVKKQSPGHLADPPELDQEPVAWIINHSDWSSSEPVLKKNIAERYESDQPGCTIPLYLRQQPVHDVAAPEVEQKPAAWIIRHPRFCGKFTDDKEIAMHWESEEQGCTAPLFLQSQPDVTHKLPAAFTEWLKTFIDLSDSAGIDDHEECWSWPSPPGDPHFFDNYPKLTTGVMRELYKHQLQPAPEIAELVEALEQLREPINMASMEYDGGYDKYVDMIDAILEAHRQQGGGV